MDGLDIAMYIGIALAGIGGLYSLFFGCDEYTSEYSVWAAGYMFAVGATLIIYTAMMMLVQYTGQQ